MKIKLTINWFIVLFVLLTAVSCSTSQKTIEINGQKVPVKTFSDEQIQADAWVLSYMTCQTDLLKHKALTDSTNNRLKLDIKNTDRSRKLFFNRMYIRYFQDSTYKQKFLKYQKEGTRLFRPCQRINAIRIMEKMQK